MRTSTIAISHVSISHINWLKTFVYTTFALIAFGANSIICRLALGTSSIDPASFTTIRIVSGAFAIGIIGGLVKGNLSKHPGNWFSAFTLTMYATCFSLAYMSLSAGTGALILFGAVQVTMFIWGLWRGERPRIFQWSGFLVALAGFVYLMLPRMETPSLSSALLMALSGVSWGIYSLRGGGAEDPVAVTGDNFLRAIPIIIPINFLVFNHLEISINGVMLAILSGAVTSGIGYVLWYEALKSLTSTRAAVSQLLVPVIAAMGGGIFLYEQFSMHLTISAFMIIIGAGSYLIGKKR
jgi:drug/metabolite transporter (DMT)-like permease